MRRLASHATLALLALVAVLALAPLASAHGALARSIPPPGARLAAPPLSFDLYFSEGIEPIASDATVTNESSHARVPLNATFPDANRMHLTFAPPLANGTYVVAWRVLSSVDGHTSDGAYPVLVGANATLDNLSIPASSPQYVIVGSFGETSARAEATAATLILVGTPLVLIYVAPPELSPRARARLRLVALAAAVVLGVASLGAAAGFAARAGGDGAGWTGTARILFGTRVGKTWLARLAASLVALVAIGFAELAWRDAEREGETSALDAATHDRALFAGLGAAGVVAALAQASTSHAAGLPLAGLAVGADIVHLLSAAAWLGGLPALLVLTLTHRHQAATYIARFGGIALVAVGLSTVTGFALALALFRSFANLWTTAYGLALLGKLALGLVLLALGGVNRYWLAPAGSPRVPRILATEAATAFAFLLAVALLTAAAPPATLPVAPGSGAPFTSERTLDGLTLHLTISPGPLVAGFHDYELDLTNATTGARANATNVTLVFAPLAGEGGGATLALRHAGPGAYEGEGVELSADGPWRIVAFVSRGASAEVRASFEVSVS
ncbi:MAG: copper resistance CopC/CopD family protein [Thermoplasmatota archaeon]